MKKLKYIDAGKVYNGVKLGSSFVGALIGSYGAGVLLSHFAPELGFWARGAIQVASAAVASAAVSLTVGEHAASFFSRKATFNNIKLAMDSNLAQKS